MKIDKHIRAFLINSLTFHHRVMARFLRRRGWVVFYLNSENRKCQDDLCWLRLYEESKI